MTADERQRSYIQNIDLVVELDAYSSENCTKVETKIDQLRNNHTFSLTLQVLFNNVASWPPRRIGIALRIQAQSPTDWGSHLEQGRRLEVERYGVDLQAGRYNRSFLEIIDDFNTNCMEVPAIGTLIVEELSSDTYRLIEPRATMIIASKVPYLKNMKLYLDDMERWDHPMAPFSGSNIEKRLKNRYSFAKSFALWPHRSLRSLYLRFKSEAPEDDSATPRDLRIDGKDTFSDYLRLYSQNLTRLDLVDVVIGPAIFRAPPPPTAYTHPEIPEWVNMTHFRVDYTSVTSDGRWWYTIDPNDTFLREQGPITEYRPNNAFRSKVDEYLLNDLYLAAGKAAMCMPDLQVLHLESQSRLGWHSFRFEVSEWQARATWSDMLGFIPSAEVQKLWKEVGKAFMVPYTMTLTKERWGDDIQELPG
ncbi:hypothetical protein N7495_003199 [Penicillium taxi]|uniref:uncharacterized protein n=1 Tax=Penicillium taxi TaxID=168475 RepID=UPI00254595E4|nr:uncharacterized protein N7495_003199 [Penicillium taxi]KAJ5902671.1 hypothetical protein N7495_003199 [Penicillium taxi]